MNARQARFPARGERGATLIEVLVAIIIVVIGLLGLAGMQARINVSEMESFQRAQAVVLVQDMVDRINANRKHSMEYNTTSSNPVGTGQAWQDCKVPTSLAARDLCEWSNLLLGSSETGGGGTKIGAMIGARGCVEAVVATMPRQFRVSVVWQGLNRTVAPTVTACGGGLYGTEDARRVVAQTLIIGCLQNDGATGSCVTP